MRPPVSPEAHRGFCTLALLNCGVEVDDPAVHKALNHLRDMGELKQTYTVALQTTVLCAAEPKKDKIQIQQNVGWLQSTPRRVGDINGAWGYGEELGRADNSNAQFALLGLHEAENVGVKVPEPIWRRTLAYWQRQQNADGSWGYTDENPGTGSMTCAGIASMIIASGQIAKLNAEVSGEDVKCCGEQEMDDSAIEKGIDWLARNFSVHRNPSVGGGAGTGRLLYYLYAMERVGRLSGRRFIGQHDWYREGAEMLLKSQDTVDGYWTGGDPIVVSTSFALLFLSKGRRPILLSKLQREPADDWNRHQNDVAHLTRYVEQRWKRDLTWQVVDWKAATAEDLWQSPVLFLNGRDGLSLTPDEKESLRRYIDMGGFLFAEACCDGQQFDKDFRTLMAELFPDSPLRLLPQDHPIWFAEQKVDSRYLRPLLGIDACCRIGVVYCPKDLSCYWELAVQQRGRQAAYVPAVQAEIDACLAIGANVLAYATGRELRNKLDTPELVSVLRNQATRDPETLYLAKLRHSGGSDDAPVALSNLRAPLGQFTQLRVSSEKRLLSIVDPSLPDYPVAFLHGRGRFRLSESERKALTRFIENGGVIFADAICASDEFAEAFRDEMKSIVPDRPLERIPPTHPLFTTQFHGHDLKTVTLRDPRARARRDDPLSTRLEKVPPLLEGIEVDGRYVVIFSPNDISCALENRPSLECRGYTREDAAKIGMNVILYAMQQ